MQIVASSNNNSEWIGRPENGSECHEHTSKVKYFFVNFLNLSKYVRALKQFDRLSVQLSFGQSHQRMRKGNQRYKDRDFGI